MAYGLKACSCHPLMYLFIKSSPFRRSKILNITHNSCLSCQAYSRIYKYRMLFDPLDTLIFKLIKISVVPSTSKRNLVNSKAELCSVHKKHNLIMLIMKNFWKKKTPWFYFSLSMTSNEIPLTHIFLHIVFRFRVTYFLGHITRV